MSTATILLKEVEKICKNCASGCQSRRKAGLMISRSFARSSTKIRCNRSRPHRLLPGHSLPCWGSERQWERLGYFPRQRQSHYFMKWRTSHLLIEMNANFERSREGAGRGLGSLRSGSRVEDDAAQPVGCRVDGGGGPCPGLQVGYLYIVSQASWEHKILELFINFSPRSCFQLLSGGYPVKNVYSKFNWVK